MCEAAYIYRQPPWSGGHLPTVTVTGPTEIGDYSCRRGAVDWVAGSDLRTRCARRATSRSLSSSFARLTDVRRQGPETVSERGRNGGVTTISTASKTMASLRRTGQRPPTGAGCLRERREPRLCPALTRTSTALYGRFCRAYGGGDAQPDVADAQVCPVISAQETH